MKYSELIQAYFERSTALQWYWTIYVLVIGGVLAFSTFRQHTDIVTTVLVMALYACFAFKNLGAIEHTLLERNTILAAIKEYPASSADAAEKHTREMLTPVLMPQEYEGVRNFHVACDLMTIAVLLAKEWRRRKNDEPTS